MNKILFLSLCLCLGSSLLVGQATISGIATDEFTGEALIGATIKVGANGTLTDFDGSYRISVDPGSYDLVVSYVGYKTKVTSIEVRGDQTVNITLEENSVLDEIVVTADIAIERETPVAFSNIPTIKIEEELAAQDIPMLLNSTPGAYATEAGGGDGDARIFFYYARIDKQINNHYLSLSGFGAPQKHGQRPFSAEAGLVDTAYALSIGVPQFAIEELAVKNQGRRYNDAWGLNDGELYNTRQNFYHKPQISLRHSWDSNKLFWSNVLYLSIGNGGGTATDGLSIPLNEDNQRDVEEAIRINQEPNFANPDGNSSTILRANRNNHFWYGILSTLRYTLNENITISGGIDGRSYNGDHFREVRDLLGGAGWKAGNNAPDSPTFQVGDKYEYDYTGLVRSIGGFGLFEYKKDKWASFLNASVANSSYGFKNNFTDFEIPFVHIPTYTIKLGATYNFNRQNGVFVNTGVLSRAQQYRNVIISNFWDTETEGQIANTFDNEEIKAVELGYNYKSKVFSANVNLYYTHWGNKPLDRLPVIAEDPGDPDSDQIPINVPGIDALHKGIEIDFVFKPISKLAIEGLASIGDWTWQSGQTVEGVLPNGVTYSYEFDARGVHVGDAAQLQIGGQIRYEPFKDFYIKAKTTFFDNNYASFQPEDLQGDNGGRDAWKMPSYFLSSFHTGYFRKFEKFNASIRFNILNLLDATYLTDARDNDNFNSPSFTDFDAKSASVFYGQGRRWSLSFQVDF